MTYTSLKASEILGKQGFSAGVINMSSIKPLDKAAVIKAAETGRIITVEEHNIIGGLGSAVAECACAEKPCRIDFIGMNDKFGESGKPELLLDKFGLTPEKIAERALNFLNKK
jgi:transketolase